jgi:hypothetical protein
LAVANYESANGHYPPAYVLGPDGRPWHSWRVLILPYIEGHDVYRGYDFNEPWDGPNNRRLIGRMPRLYQFHNRPREGQTTTNYLAVVGPDTMWPGAEKRLRKDVAGNHSTTLLVVENRGLDVVWTEPRDLNVGTMPFEVNHPHGLSSWYKTPGAAMADGSVVTIPLGSDPAALRAAVTAVGPKALSLDANGWRVMPDGRHREDAPP